MTKYVFVKNPVVHLIADTQVVFSEDLGNSLRRRGADIPQHKVTVGDNKNSVTVNYDSQMVGWFGNLIPHGNGDYSDAEDLAVFCGKQCYNAFGKNGSTRTHEEYLANSTYDAKPFGHYSIAYHPHFTLWISGISRRIGEELKRHVIGTSVSQMSSRYCIHPPRFVVPPKYLDNAYDAQNYPKYKRSCKQAYRNYLALVSDAHTKKGLERKRVLEAAADLLPMGIETTIIMTFNPISARKFILERLGETSDLEIQRLAAKVQSVLESRYKAFRFR